MWCKKATAPSNVHPVSSACVCMCCPVSYQAGSARPPHPTSRDHHSFVLLRCNTAGFFSPLVCVCVLRKHAVIDLLADFTFIWHFDLFLISVIKGRKGWMFEVKEQHRWSFRSGTYGVFWFLAAIVQRLFWKVVSSNQGEFPDEHCVPIVGPHGNLKNKDPVRGVLSSKSIHHLLTTNMSRRINTFAFGRGWTTLCSFHFKKARKSMEPCLKLCVWTISFEDKRKKRYRQKIKKVRTLFAELGCRPT